MPEPSARLPKELAKQIAGWFFADLERLRMDEAAKLLRQRLQTITAFNKTLGDTLVDSMDAVTTQEPESGRDRLAAFEEAFAAARDRLLRALDPE